MAKVSRVNRLKKRSRYTKAEQPRTPSRSHTHTHTHKLFKNSTRKSSSIKLSEKKDYEDAKCSVCMEAPHNAVLLLCSSYNKGCRPYMCATSYRFSNCLDQYKKAYTKSSSTGPTNPVEENTGICELLCPLCRGQVKGWTLVEQARTHLNKKKRTCMEEKCSFVGNFKQLKKHVKADHPSARPREVDPSLEEKWRSLENEREIDDVISTLPAGSVVVGDYVIDPNTNPFFNFGMGDFFDEDAGPGSTRFRSGGFRFLTAHHGHGHDSDSESESDDDGGGGVIRPIPIRRNFGSRALLTSRRSRRWF